MTKPTLIQQIEWTKFPPGLAEEYGGKRLNKKESAALEKIIGQIDAELDAILPGHKIEWEMMQDHMLLYHNANRGWLGYIDAPSFINLHLTNWRQGKNSLPHWITTPDQTVEIDNDQWVMLDELGFEPGYKISESVATVLLVYAEQRKLLEHKDPAVVVLANKLIDRVWVYLADLQYRKECGWPSIPLYPEPVAA